ncbi:MAG: hypothetical protein VX026_11560 [Myxococcota bacterium]|nr:hypothetical protein [Myxococcota bacterium]
MSVSIAVSISSPLSAKVDSLHDDNDSDDDKHSKNTPQKSTTSATEHIFELTPSPVPSS